VGLEGYSGFEVKYIQVKIGFIRLIYGAENRRTQFTRCRHFLILFFLAGFSFPTRVICGGVA
jgi:hypothetical protein